MHRFFIKKQDLLSEGRATLTTVSDVKHLSRVLRASVGEWVELCVDNEEEWVGKIERIEPTCVFFSELEKRMVDRESPIDIHLYQGLPKADKMEWIVQKSVELGANEITAVQMIRSVAKISDEKDNQKKTDRWQKIADEAAKQSKRQKQVVVNASIRVKALLEKISEYDLFLVLYELESEASLKNLLEQAQKSEEGIRKVAVLVGPEGGIEGSEMALLLEKGAKSITLGKRILRTETAALAAISVIQYELGDFGS